MPGCRRSAPATTASHLGEGARLSRYVTSGRMSVRAANDNHGSGWTGFWPWAAFIALAPIVSAAVILVGLL